MRFGVIRKPCGHTVFVLFWPPSYFIRTYRPFYPIRVNLVLFGMLNLEISKGAKALKALKALKRHLDFLDPSYKFCEWSLFYDTFLKLTVLECPIYVLAIGSPQSKLCYKGIKIHKLCIWI